MNFTKCPFTSSSCQDGGRKLWWKRSPSPSLSLSAFWEMRPSPRLLLSCGVFKWRAPTGKVSGQFLTWICIPQWRVTALKGQEKTGASIDSWKLFKETDELKEQRASHTSLPSLHPCKPPLALKNRTSLNCATRCLYHGAEGELWRGCVRGRWRIRASPQKSY